jgi:hypothetical protein
VLNRAEGKRSADLGAYERLWQAWRDRRDLTPRMAAGFAYAIDGFADLGIGSWLDGSDSAPLHAVDPFGAVDLRIMMAVADNRAWAALAGDRCRAVADEIDKGVLPFDRPGCYFDELLMALALGWARDFHADGLHDDALPARDRPEPELDGLDTIFDDSDWIDEVEANFDDAARFEDWQVPRFKGHPRVSDLLAARPPYTWFDGIQYE